MSTQTDLEGTLIDNNQRRSFKQSLHGPQLFLWEWGEKRGPPETREEWRQLGQEAIRRGLFGGDDS